jgi:hypothetical protein
MPPRTPLSSSTAQPHEEKLPLATEEAAATTLPADTEASAVVEYLPETLLLTAAVETVVRCAHPPPPPAPVPPALGPRALQLSVVGKPFAGKSAILARLAARRGNAVVLRVADLATDAVIAFRAGELAPRPETPAKAVVAAVEVTAAMSELASGSSVDEGVAAVGNVVAEAVSPSNELAAARATTPSVVVSEEAAEHFTEAVLPSVENDPAAEAMADAEQEKTTAEEPPSPPPPPSPPMAAVPSLSTRALLGEQVLAVPHAMGTSGSLRVDTAVLSDALKVALLCDAIERLPSDVTGWLLDGFPATAAQADLWEHTLASAFAHHHGHHPAESVVPGHRPLVSLHAVLLLDVPDAEILRRAFGYTRDPLSGRVYHMRTDPAPVSVATLGLQSRLIPCLPPSSTVDSEHILHTVPDQLPKCTAATKALLAWLGPANVYVCALRV